MIRTSFPGSWTVGPKLGAFERPDASTAPRLVRLPHDALRDLARDPRTEQGVHAGYIPGGVFEYAVEFDAVDDAGNDAEKLIFTLILVDHVAPSITPANGLPTSIESCNVDNMFQDQTDVSLWNMLWFVLGLLRMRLGLHAKPS